MWIHTSNLYFIYNFLNYHSRLFNHNFTDFQTRFDLDTFLWISTLTLRRHVCIFFRIHHIFSLTLSSLPVVISNSRFCTMTHRIYVIVSNVICFPNCDRNLVTELWIRCYLEGTGCVRLSFPFDEFSIFMEVFIVCRMIDR